MPALNTSLHLIHDRLLGLYLKAFSHITKEEEQRALRIHREAIVVDGLACPAVTRGEFDRMVQGGVTAANWTIASLGHDLGQTVRDMAVWYSLFRENNSKVMAIATAEDVRGAKKQNKLGVVFGLQDPKPIEEDVAILEVLHRLGARIIQLTYNERGLIGDGATEKTDSGLSRLGHNVVREMNRLGILIDVSHCGRRTALEAIDTSREPVVFSHANAKALCNNPRNKSDEEIKAVAEKGGIIGAVAWGQLMWSKEGQQPTIDDFLNQIDYMVDLVGVNHVGIAMDISEGVFVGEKGKEASVAYDAKYPQVIACWMTGDPSPGEAYTRDLGSYIQVPNITKGLVGRGYSDQDIKKILGENFLRVFEIVW